MSDRADFFPHLLRSAVLGTQHAAPDVSSGDSALDAAFAARPGELAERTLLRGAAAFAAMSRIGAPPRTLAIDAPPAEPDARPRCGTLSSDDLRSILSGERGDPATSAELLAEWLTLAIRFERRVPEQLLPALLDRGAQAIDLCAALHTAIDARGHWLAPQNPRWTYAVAKPDDARTFEEADSATARAAALGRLRAADPAAARATLEASWTTESPADRATLLAALATRLSPEDEPFLTLARDDKRKEVRRAATDLLTALPDSAAVRRAIAACTPLVRFERRPLRRPKLVVGLPEAVSDELLRDGIEPEAGRPGVGHRAAVLEQLIERVPPAHWRASLAVSSGDLFDAALDHEFGEILVRGFALGISRFRDGDGLAQLLALVVHEPRYFDAYVRADHDGLATTAREAHVRDALRHRRDRAGDLLTLLRSPWSPALSRDAIGYVRGSIEIEGSALAMVRDSPLFRAIAARIDPSTPEIERGWPETYRHERHRDLVTTMLGAIRFRVEMLEHFADDAHAASEVRAERFVEGRPS